MGFKSFINCMNTLKQEALTAISHVPETANIDTIMYQVYVIEKVGKGREALEKGETASALKAGEK